ncbi:MAG: hypothetical protein B6D46_07520 [Polyangiaceae bacterium UTPRO1]|nr:MAG: hypothetical protein B6D46_07520 [Polyangiaceae bacterium UTPRO1]
MSTGVAANAVLVALATAAVIGLTPVRSPAGLDGAGFYRRDCARCHGPHGRGDGPDSTLFTSPPRDLRSDFLGKYSTTELVRRVRRGSPLRLDVNPKALADREREVAALVAYVRQLPDVDPRRFAAGLDLYAQRCEACHGPYGRAAATTAAAGAQPRDLSDPAFQRETSDAALAVLVRHGRSGMPSLKPPLSPTDADTVASYVRLLSPGYELYVQFCANCHGDDGRGNPTAGLQVPPKVLDAAYMRTHDEAALGNAVWHMMRDKKPQMPHLRHQVSETAAQAIVEFLKGLQH